ncbi:hypothetical protein PFISCL1PPCAC_18965, partial [Pristionchus fissidentatus]
ERELDKSLVQLNEKQHYNVKERARQNSVDLTDCVSLPQKRAKEEEGEASEHTSLLDLPNEILLRIFSFLPIHDRWKLRVNKELKRIEEMQTNIYVGAIAFVPRR